MATLAELGTLYSRGTPESEVLLDKVKAAVLIAAEAIRVEAAAVPNHNDRFAWAKGAFVDPRAKAVQMWGAILAANATSTTVQILGASEASIQTAVNNAVNIFAIPDPATVP